MRAGIIGGGLCGLSAAIHLARKGAQVEIFEAAPTAGGRTRSFYDARIEQWVDNGPHLLSGAYRETMALLDMADAGQNVSWQHALHLPLWDRKRGRFDLRPTRALPLALALPLACYRLPGHGIMDISDIIKLARQLDATERESSVQTWLARLGVNPALIGDLLEPLCLGAMNEPPETANAASFALVLREAFASHAHARLGWFNKPLQTALVEPLVELAKRLGVRLHCGTRIHAICKTNAGIELETSTGAYVFDKAINALPLRAASRLLNLSRPVPTRGIINVHLWFADMPPLDAPFIGAPGATGQWFFDVSQQMPDVRPPRNLRHICCVISAADAIADKRALTSTLVQELGAIANRRLAPVHARIVHEHFATTGIAMHALEDHPGDALVNACEAPQAGDFPATIESAVLRGQRAAECC